MRCDHSCWNSVHHLFLSPARSESPTSSSANSICSKLASRTLFLASSSCTFCLHKDMAAMLGRRYRKSIVEEGGMNTGRTWTEDGQRRQAGPFVGLHRLFTCPPGRSGVVSHRLKPLLAPSDAHCRERPAHPARPFVGTSDAAYSLQCPGLVTPS